MAATVVIPGPGDMNAMNGLKNALNDCTPLLHIAVETEPEIRGGDGIHETPPDTYDNVVKENITVETPESTVAELQRAIDAAQTAPNGPVRIGIPKNFLKMDVSLAERGDIERQTFSGVPRTKSPPRRTSSRTRRSRSSSPAAAFGRLRRATNCERSPNGSRPRSFSRTRGRPSSPTTTNSWAASSVAGPERPSRN